MNQTTEVKDLCNANFKTLRKTELKKHWMMEKGSVPLTGRINTVKMTLLSQGQYSHTRILTTSFTEQNKTKNKTKFHMKTRTQTATVILSKTELKVAQHRAI